MSYWIMKSEPDVYGIHDLQREGSTLWDGIRNYQARNYMRAMREGDQAFFYHSNTRFPGIIGLMQVIEANVCDPTQFDPASKYFDPRSKPENPRWDCVRLRYLREFSHLLSLDELKREFSIDELALVRRGNRLSIIPVSKQTANRLFEILLKES